MKKALAGLAIILVLAGAGAWLAYNYLDVIVKVALEHYGPDVTGAKVKVEQVAISPRDGRGAIRGLEVGNPAGFTSARAARFGEIRVALDPSTLTEKVVRIRELAIESSQVTYERGSKATNLDALSANIEAYVKKSGDATAGGGAAREGKRRFVIDRITIRNTRVLMTNPALRGQGVSFELPAVELRDVGKRQGGVTAGEAANIVATAFQVRIAQKVLTNFDLLKKGGVEGAIDALKGLMK